MHLKYFWLLTILFSLKHHHSPSPELLILIQKGFYWGIAVHPFISAQLHLCKTPGTTAHVYQSLNISESWPSILSVLPTLGHEGLLSCPRQVLQYQGGQWLQTGTAQSGLCRGPGPAGSPPKNVSGRRQGDLRKHLQLQPQQAGCCSPDNNRLMWQAPAKPSPDNLCAASCPSSTQASTHQPWPWDFQGRRATQNTKGSQIPRSRAGLAELLTYQG